MRDLIDKGIALSQLNQIEGMNYRIFIVLGLLPLTLTTAWGTWEAISRRATTSQMAVNLPILPRPDTEAKQAVEVLVKSLHDPYDNARWIALETVGDTPPEITQSSQNVRQSLVFVTRYVHLASELRDVKALSKKQLDDVSAALTEFTDQLAQVHSKIHHSDELASQVNHHLNELIDENRRRNDDDFNKQVISRARTAHAGAKYDDSILLLEQYKGPLPDFAATLKRSAQFRKEGEKLNISIGKMLAGNVTADQSSLMRDVDRFLTASFPEFPQESDKPLHVALTLGLRRMRMRSSIRGLESKVLAEPAKWAAEAAIVIQEFRDAECEQLVKEATREYLERQIPAKSTEAVDLQYVVLESDNRVREGVFVEASNGRYYKFFPSRAAAMDESYAYDIIQPAKLKPPKKPQELMPIALVKEYLSDRQSLLQRRHVLSAWQSFLNSYTIKQAQLKEYGDHGGKLRLVANKPDEVSFEKELSFTALMIKDWIEIEPLLK